MQQTKKDRLLEILEATRKMHEDFYSREEADHEAAPMYILFREGVVHTIAIVEIGETSQEKNMVCFGIRSIAEKSECDAFAFSSEGWTIPKEALKSYKPGDRFANRVDKIEVFTVQVGLNSGEFAVQPARMNRSGEHPTLEWEEVLLDGDGAAAKSIFNIFKPLPEFLGGLDSVSLN